MPAELPTSSVLPFDLPEWQPAPTIPLTKAPPELDPADPDLREEDEDIMVRPFRGSPYTITRRPGVVFRTRFCLILT